MFAPAKTSGGSSHEGRATHGVTTVIARGVKVEGEFISQGDVTIEGDVYGTLATTGLLIVGPESKIRANVQAGDAVISGVVEGNIVVAKRLEIKASAKLLGDVSAETLSIEAGAELNGRLSVGTRATVAELVPEAQYQSEASTFAATAEG